MKIRKVEANEKRYRETKIFAPKWIDFGCNESNRILNKQTKLPNDNKKKPTAI